MVLVIDNYDSFVYNLVQYLGILKQKVFVVRNDKIKLKEVKKMKPSSIVISPGPGTPRDAGISCELIDYFAGEIPILGVCLGHQAIGEVFGAEVVKVYPPIHGKVSKIFHDQKTIFQGIENPFIATRYHSLIVKRNGLPNCLRLTAWTDDQLVMGIRHKKFIVEGVQFHPESILTNRGMKIIRNFLRRSVICR